ncbi:ExbD/TolR family protein [Desulfohalobium retbaense]|uniref:Biopolymer transport protein ExbD/TolR n=1 Tax=Desulfohalobium retbaense (strain ATCC 49708 / DSM 5692 / JCM 16813 / HR100) TaxID=485915 RepID=C8X3E3_DESRD|nr:biopolymer transporter ExbD [Desulfohalobium retbaense]ACV68940.1 Biopolymer transport protein ExbD/TolR [Desulfohalobium retbaense DSM 5692]
MASGRRYRQSDKRSQTELNLTPLIDMVFILLIFFLVTSHFARETGIEVSRPEAASVESAPAQHLRITIRADNQIFIRGQHVDIRRLQEHLESRLRDQPLQAAVVTADEASRSGTLVQVLDACRLSGLDDVTVAGRRPEESGP